MQGLRKQQISLYKSKIEMSELIQSKYKMLANSDVENRLEKHNNGCL